MVLLSTALPASLPPLLLLVLLLLASLLVLLLLASLLLLLAASLLRSRRCCSACCWGTPAQSAGGDTMEVPLSPPQVCCSKAKQRSVWRGPTW